MEYQDVQRIAKETISYIKTVIRPNMNLIDVRHLCEEKMLSLGADSFWYWDIGAFVFSGDETTVSVSGREYITSDRSIGSNDMITIDLSPQCNHIWGDYARTIVIENGKAADSIEQIQNDEWRNGLLMEERLHRELIAFVTPQTSFEELYLHINDYIIENGFINLDFMGNLGHSIVKNKDDRVYIEKGNHALLSSVDFFTFEPHISIPNSKYGYKKENIYYFSDGKLAEL
ncbi:MAG: aminopeptidase P family protein [Oscillospiraceae bacterium]|nr:aminopeptidase P family protein [Oscillospiraceae bacterium]